MGKQDWETPDYLFELLDQRWGFTIDGAAESHNTKCERYIDPETNAFQTELSGERVFCNPPYADMMPWVERFISWSKDNVVVALVQDKTDTVWFKTLWENSVTVWFLHGRIQFKGTQTGNMHGACVFVLDSRLPGPPTVKIWDWKVEL